MDTLNPILKDLRERVLRAAGDVQTQNRIVMAVAEVATLLDQELDNVVAGMQIRHINHPIIAANHDVRALLWHAVGVGLIANVSNKTPPILTLSIVPDSAHTAYYAEVARLVPLIHDIFERRL